MSFETNLNQAPYHDDFDPAKNFYGVLFKPGYSVQTRELNQLQSILRKQIERFGDNILKKGTIVDGCNFGFHNPYAYAKIKDTQVDGTPVSPESLIGYYAQDESTGLTGVIINAVDGYESADPDTKTIYIKYIDSGTSRNQTKFVADGTLRISSRNQQIENIVVNNGGVGFSNNDTLIALPAMVVTVTTGTIANGSYIQSAEGANVQVIEVDDTTLADEDKIILRVIPRDEDLELASANLELWEIAANSEITNAGNTIAGTVDRLIGSGLAGTIRTNGVGTIENIIITSGGSDYETLPTVRVFSPNNTTGLAALDLAAENYIARVKVINKADAVGNGYAFSVSGGVIYYRGAFLSVDPQTVIVEKYSQSPNAVAVGFSATEEIITSDIDTSLLDNALGEPNESAPGADRLKVTPVLTVKDSAEGNADETFFAICEWSEGKPYKQNQYTEYNVIGDEMARRHNDLSGDYVLNPFQVTTRSPFSGTNEGRKFTVVIDPGEAYIQGHKVRTESNYTLDLDKGIDTNIYNNFKTSLNYGNYIRVKNFAGTFQFSNAKRIRFYGAVKDYYNHADATTGAMTVPGGGVIGTARIRSVVLENGVAGTPEAIYRVYLFDFQLTRGKKWNDARSVYAIDAPYGVADIVLELDATTNTEVPVIKDTKNDGLLFKTGLPTIKNSNNMTYQYRTINTTAVAMANDGTSTFDISATSNEYFPFSGELTDAQMKTITMTLDTGVKAANDATGTVTVSTTSDTVVGSGTSFITEFEAGDFIYLYANSSGGGDVRRVTSVVNNTYLTIQSNGSFSNASSKAARYFPAHVPIPFGSRDGLSANVSSNGNILNLYLNLDVDSASDINAAVTVNIERQNVTPTTKTVNRNKFVKLNLGTHANGTSGPWCLGVTDIFRLRGVYIGDSTVNTNSTNILSDFYVDHNQNQNYLNLGFLYRVNGAKRRLTSSNYLLVEFDYFTRADSGLFNTVSYTHTENSAAIFVNDSLPLSNLTTDANYLEIPSVTTPKGEEFDLKTVFDARPRVTHTATPGSTAAGAPTNPTYTLAFPDIEYKFPLPDTVLDCTIESWRGRNDSILVDKDGRVFAMKNKNAPSSGTMLLNKLVIPAYPSVPERPSVQLNKILNTRVGNGKFSQKQFFDRTIKTELTEAQITNMYQPKGYTMQDIGNLERRISDLEYYVSLTLQESELNKRAIPSSIDPLVNRFKFGFFVDDFNSPLNSDYQDSQFSVMYNAGRIYPTTGRLNLLGYESDIIPPYVDHTIISQAYASLTGLEANCVPNTEYAILKNFEVQPEWSKAVAVNGATNFWVDRSSNIYLANVSSPAVIYFDAAYVPTRIEVYQDDVLIKTSESAANLTTSDISMLKTQTAGFFTSSNLLINTVSTTESGNPETPTNLYVKNAGKIAWSHDPSAGRTYYVKTYYRSTPLNQRWKYLFDVPIDANSVGCTIDANTPNTPPPVHTGTIKITPDELILEASIIVFDSINGE